MKIVIKEINLLPNKLTRKGKKFLNKETKIKNLKIYFSLILIKKL